MNALDVWLADLVDGPWAAPLGILAKVTGVLALAWTADLSLRRANPRWRILLWRATGIGAVLMAALATAPATFRLPLPVVPGLAEAATEAAPRFESGSAAASARHSRPAPPRPNFHMGATAPAMGSPETAERRPVSAESKAAASRSDSPPIPWVRWALSAWAVGVACGVFRMLVGSARVATIRRASSPVPEWIEAEVNRAAEGVAGRCRLEARRTTAVTTPCSAGLIRKMILLPDALCREDRRNDLRAALTHEAAHFRGRDLSWNHLLHVVSVLLWFHPLAWRLRLAHADACDERCDADAAACLGDPDGYGRALARLALAVAGRTPPAVLAMARRSGVRRRIERLGRGGAERLQPWSAGVATTAAAVAVTAVALLGLEPTRAQEAAKAADAAVTTEGETAPPAASTEAAPAAEETAGATKVVRVIDPEQNPVAGATVVPWAIRSQFGHGLWTPKGMGGSEPPTLTTDADGVAGVPIPAYAEPQEKLPPLALTVRVEHPDFAQSVYNNVPVSGDERDGVSTITLTRGAVVEVAATENGRPLDPENLYALTASPSQGPGRKVSRGPDGTLRLPRLPAGQELLRVIHLPPDGPPTFGEVQQFGLVEGETRRIEVEMRPAVEVAGRIDPGVPRPVINGRVIAEVLDVIPGDATRSISWRTWARINPDGTFRLGGLPRGDLQVIALADGYMAASGDPPAFADANERARVASFSMPQVFPLAEGTTNVVLKMTPTAEAVVRAVTADGAPVAGAEVGFWPNVKWWGGGSQIYAHPLYRTADALKEGEFEWGSLFDPDDQPFAGTTGDDGTAVVVNLPPGDESFTVDHEKFEMAAGDQGGFRSQSIELVGGRRSETTVVLHPKGSQPIGEPGVVPAERVDRNETTVIPKTRPPRIVPTQAGEAELAGVVLDEGGRPLEGVEVDAWTWHPGNETTTDAEGRFSLKGFEDDRDIEVEFTKDGYSPSLFIGQPLGTDDWTVVLTQGTWLEGAVTAPDGSSVPGALVRAYRGPFRNPGVVIDEVWTETKAGDDGNYRLHLEAGTYDIQVRQPDVGVVRHQKVAVAPKEKKRLDLALESGVTFRAVVRDSVTGEPVEGIVLWNWRQPGIEGTSDADGVLEITGMTEGEFEFGVTAEGTDRLRSSVAGDYARWWSPAAVHEHQRLKADGGEFQRNFDDLTFLLKGDSVEVDVFVEPAVTIIGRVLDPGGSPVAGATVAPAKTGSGNSLTGDTRFSYETDADGRFEMKLPASGNVDYNLIVHDGKYGEWRTWANGFGEPFRTTPGDVIDDVELRLTRPATVRGRVTDSIGRPRRNIEVRAASTDARDNRYYLPTARTDDDGRYELKFVAPGEHHIQIEPFWLRAAEAPGGTSKVVDIAEGETLEGADFVAD